MAGSSLKTRRLAPFILANLDVILEEWDDFAGSLDSGMRMTDRALRDHAEMLLRATAKDMEAAQSLAQQENKAEGRGGADSAESEQLDHASANHGTERVDSGFDIIEVVSEYRALRASVLRLWCKGFSQPDLDDIDDIVRFNESMDQSLAKAVDSFTKGIERSRLMFLAILTHDMRNPLNCISMAAAMLSRKMADPDSDRALVQIKSTTQEISSLITDLIDFASTGLGGVMPLTRGLVDLEIVCSEVIDGFHFTHPQRMLRFRPQGDLTGDWDGARLRQVVSNLISNALQHGTDQGLIDLTLAAEESTVVLKVKNEGAPIPPDLLEKIFDPLMRHSTLEPEEPPIARSIGLGLYIVREIVVAHGGNIKVDSTADEGTTFTIRLPRTDTEDATEAEAGSDPA